MKTGISFSDAAHILGQDKHSPFLCEINEGADNELHIIICRSEVDDNRDIIEYSGNTALDEILKNCSPIEPNQNRKFELVFENYIIYQVRNESYCSYDSAEICIGKHLPSLDKGTHGQKRVNLCPCFVTFTPRTSSTRRSSALQGHKFIPFRLCDPKS